ncbi:MAG: RNA 2',3'-cyclic phosphodiesterase [Actinomycetota bacterium]
MARDRASRPEAEPQRLFVAVSIPPAAADAVGAAIEPWRETFPMARWVPQGNWHVTLAFLGSTYPRLVWWVQGQLAEVAERTSPIQTRVRGLGAFPSAGRARVLWVGLDDDPGAIAALAAAARDALAREFPPETRAFSAHLTVARSDPPLTLPAAFTETPLESEPFSLDELVLMRSRVRRPAPVYERVATFPLGGSERTGSSEAARA